MIKRERLIEILHDTILIKEVECNADLILDEIEKSPAHSPDKAVTREANSAAAVEAALSSCEADGHKCSCRRFGWQFDADAHQCTARISAAFAALASDVQGEVQTQEGGTKTENMPGDITQTRLDLCLRMAEDADFPEQRYGFRLEAENIRRKLAPPAPADRSEGDTVNKQNSD